MKTLKLTMVAILVAALALTTTFTKIVSSQGGATKATANTDDQNNQDRFRPHGVIEDEEPASPNDRLSRSSSEGDRLSRATEAPVGFVYWKSLS